MVAIYIRTYAIFRLKQIGDANPKRRKTLLMVKEQIEIKRSKELKRIQDETPTKSTSSMVLGEILWILRPVVYCKSFNVFDNNIYDILMIYIIW